MTARGFVLQPTYRIESGRPVVHLWGRLDGGETFLVRDNRLRPHFWIRAADVERARRVGAVEVVPSRRKNMRGEPLARIEVPTPADTPPLRNRLQALGVECFEADVRFAMRYLIDLGVRGSLEIAGDGAPGRGVDRVFENPTVTAGDWTPRLSLLSIDIETDPRARRILSVALDGCGAAEVLMMTPPGYSRPANATAVDSEAELLRLLCRRIRELDPDVISGWNVADFDFRVLLARADELGVRFVAGRGPGDTRYRRGRGLWDASRVSLPGRLVLDGIDLLRGAFIRMESYSLEAVSRQVLGEGKLMTGGGRAAEILAAFRHDRERLAEYNLQDARLVNRILEKLGLLELSVERSRLTGLPPDRVASSVAAFDSLYLSRLGPMGIVAPSVRSEVESVEPMGGGHVFEPRAGLYENVLLFDVRSLYPSLIRTFQIDPLGLVRRPAGDDDLILAPNGVGFRRRPAILPQLLDELFPRRAAALAAGDKITSQAIKILMNSFYGVFGTPVCRFYEPAIANAITGFGRELLRWCRDRLESDGLQVLYGDTDSLFVAAGVADAAAARARGAELVSALNAELAAHVERRWRVESRIEMELESLYLKLFLPPVRHGTRGARKRYAGLIEEPDGERRVVFTGLEVVRRDWTELARATQRELYERLFFERPVDEYLRARVADLRAGVLDDLLVYRKRLRKELSAYTATTPPHVAAARKRSGPPKRSIRYVMTTAGAEPVDERGSPLDYEHYVDKQLRPVAEPVLALLELDFARVIGDDTQLDLFES